MRNTIFGSPFSIYFFKTINEQSKIEKKIKTFVRSLCVNHRNWPVLKVRLAFVLNVNKNKKATNDYWENWIIIIVQPVFVVIVTIHVTSSRFGVRIDHSFSACYAIYTKGARFRVFCVCVREVCTLLALRVLSSNSNSSSNSSGSKIIKQDS